MGKQYIDYLLVAIERNSLRGKLRRSLLIILLSLLTVETSHAQVNSSSDRPKVAVVLSGGGAKGVAHIGALKVIEEAGIPVDIICGTSMGALIGGLYSIGWTTEQLDSLVRAQDWTFLLSDRTDPARLTLRQRQQQNTYALIRGLTITDRQKNNGGLIRGRNLMTLFRQLCTGYLDSMSFDELPIPFACVATDIATNTEVDFHSGSLTRAMRSSMAIPGVFTPVRMDTMVLVDGGLRNNYPADLAREMGADIIIGVSVQGNPLSSEQLKDAMSIFEQIIDINCKNKVDENVKISDIYIEVPVDGYSAASFYAAAIDTLLHRGEAEARTHWAELVSLRDRYHLQRAPRPAKETEKPVDKRQPRPEPIPTVHIGFRFDSEEMGTVQLGVGIPFHTRIPTELRASLRLGRRIVAHAEYSLFPHSFTSPTLAYTFHRNDFDVYLMGDRIVNLRYNLHQTDFIPINTRLNKFNLTAGLRWDYFHYRDHMLSTLTLFDDPKDQHTLSYRGEVLLNTENEWYFPSRGINFQASYAYITDNLVGYDGGLGLTDIAFHWRFNIPVGRRFSLQPMLYGRLFFGSEQPLPYATTLGTEWFGQYTATQMPFDGVRFIEYIERHLLAFRLQMQYRLLSNHFVQLRLSAGATTNDLGDIPFNREHTLAGGSLAYFYNTIFGPLGFTVGYCNRIDRPVVYITLGHRF